MNNIIEIHNVSKIYKLYDKPIDRMYEALGFSKAKLYKEHFALKDICFSIGHGEIVGFVGKNGAGKSTLLKIITELLTPTFGTVHVIGSISALLELGTGFNPEYTGIENIHLYETMMGKSKEEIDKDIPKVMEFADIGDFIYQPVKTYSSGMFARLAFSVAVNVNPDILICDEILAVGDLDFQLKCMNKMKEMMQGGATVLFVSHDINAIKRFCTRAIWLKEGTLAQDGNVDEVTDNYIDYLKCDSFLINKNLDNEKQTDMREMKVDNALNIKAEIISFKILDQYNREVDAFSRTEPIIIEVTYHVYSSVTQPVLGIAIRGIDDEYMCGLNTLLDGCKIEWEKGINKLYLEYPSGILLIGGKYYFDVALFDDTATVQIEYRAKIKEFMIRDKYRGEGRFIIPHEWKRSC